jgi:hypothetical protein
MALISEKPDAYGPFWVRFICVMRRRWPSIVSSPLRNTNVYLYCEDIYVSNICRRCFVAHQQLSVILDGWKDLVCSQLLVQTPFDTFWNTHTHTHTHTQSVRNYDFQSFLTLASLIYSFAGGVPVIMWLGLRQFNAKFKLITAICLYGYSLLIFVPIAVS